MDNQKEIKVINKFNDEAPRYDNRYKGFNSTAHSFNMRRQRVFELVGNKKGKVLDIGCGSGVMVDGFKKKDYEFYGVDLAQDMVDKCREKYSNLDNVYFSVGKAEEVDFPDGTFDVVVCMGVVEYLEDDFDVLKEIHRVLKPEGVAIITLPNKKCPYRIWNRLVIKKLSKIIKNLLGQKRYNLDHREYSEEEYKKSMQKIGFEVPDIFYYNFQILPFPIDKYLPIITVPISRFFEKFYKGRLRWLGTGFIVKGVKK